MNCKKFLVIFILILTLSASCAQARISEQLALSDQRFSPYIDFTKQTGAKLLSGRYAHLREIASRSGNGQKINAPDEIIVEIGEFDPESNAYPTNFDVYGENLLHCYMTFDASGAVPVLKTYAPDDDEEDYILIAEDYVVFVPEADNENYVLVLGSVETGDVRYMFQINDYWLPKNWYEGSWKGNDGSQITLKNGTVTSNGNNLGTFIVSDNRIAVKMPDGKRDVIFCAINKAENTLVMTFTNGEDFEGANAAVFTKEKKSGTKKNSPVFKSPTKKSKEPKTKSDSKNFPKFPGSKQKFSLEGSWETTMNGQQVVMQMQGNKYWTWINGQPFDTGTFTFDGIQSLQGTSEVSPEYSFDNIVSFNADGNSFVFWDVNNDSLKLTCTKITE